MQYWSSKILDLVLSLVALNTQAMECAMSEATPSQQWWVSKHITVQLPMEKYGTPGPAILSN